MAQVVRFLREWMSRIWVDSLIMGLIYCLLWLSKQLPPRMLNLAIGIAAGGIAAWTYSILAHRGKEQLGLQLLETLRGIALLLTIVPLLGVWLGLPGILAGFQLALALAAYVIGRRRYAPLRSFRPDGSEATTPE